MPQKQVAVLSFGSEKLTTVIGSRGVNNTFSIKGSGEVDYAGFMDGEFIEPETLKFAIALSISNAENSSGCNISELYISVPAEFCFCVCKNISTNFNKPRIIKQRDVDEIFARAYEFNKYPAHVVINQSSVYFMLDDNTTVSDLIGKTAVKLGALVSFVLAERGFVELLNSFVKDLELAHVVYISSELAEAQYLFSEEERENYAIMVDCGHLTTSVSLIRGNGLLSLSSFSMGGGHITADLSECLKITFKAAESLKRKIVLSAEPSLTDSYEIAEGEQITQINMRNANEIVKARIEEIGRLITAALNNAKYECPDSTKISLTGGGLSYIKGAKDYLSKVLGKPVEVVAPGNPTMNRPHYSAVLGLLSSALKREEGKDGGMKKLLKKFFR